RRPHRDRARRAEGLGRRQLRLRCHAGAARHRADHRAWRACGLARRAGAGVSGALGAGSEAGGRMSMLASPIAFPVDGRQSETALAVARGTQRLLVSLGHACVCELPLASGRRADLVALGHDGEIWIIEIKSSIEDFRVDTKWPDYRL